MRWLSRVALLLFLIVFTWLGNIAQLGVAVPPSEGRTGVVEKTGKWFPKETNGLNHVFLWGDPFERGYTYGHFTKEILRLQEESLVNRLNELFPSSILRLVMFLVAKRLFWGIDAYLDDEWKREMHGVSMHSPKKFDSFADPYTRQIAYHGLHEVGQMFVDYGSEGFACTVIAVPRGKEWLIGRNFDFEGGRIFDDEKILKWVFPEKGFPFVSVIWAGMVGAVTGVNAKGVYLSLNAAGSKDYSRLGTPSTLVLLKALQFSSTAEEAISIIKSEKTLITEIFVVNGPGSTLYVVEKSPERTVVTSHSRPIAVANHLLSPTWENDPVNLYRRTDLTSSARLKRGQELAEQLSKQIGRDSLIDSNRMARALRDKMAGENFLPGNRSTIDALIATHSVIYDAGEMSLFVSQGPSNSGGFLGYDLRKSFFKREPVVVGAIEEDKEVPPASYIKAKQDITFFERFVKGKENWDCGEFGQILSDIQPRLDHYLKYMAIGMVEERCLGRSQAQSSWKKALELKPAYERERRIIKERLL